MRPYFSIAKDWCPTEKRTRLSHSAIVLSSFSDDTGAQENIPSSISLVRLSQILAPPPPTDISCVATEELRNFQRRVKLKRSRTDLQDIQACSPPLRCDKPVACMHPEIRPEIDRSLFGRKLVNSSSAVIDSIDSNDSRCCESFIIVSLQFD